MTDKTYTRQVSWDEIISVIRAASPRLTTVGGDSGGDAERIMALLTNEAVVERVALGIYQANSNYRVAVRDIEPKMEKAKNDRYEAIARVVDDLKAVKA